MFISIENSLKLGRRISKFVKVFDNKQLRKALRESRLKVKSLDYLGAVLINSIFYCLLFGSLFTALLLTQVSLESIHRYLDVFFSREASFFPRLRGTQQQYSRL